MNDYDRKLVEALQSSLNAQPAVVQLSSLEALRSSVLSLRVKLGKELAIAREKMRMPNYKPDPKDKDTPRYTDFDRTTMLNAAVADLEAEYELIKGLENLVKERIEVIKWLG